MVGEFLEIIRSGGSAVKQMIMGQGKTTVSELRAGHCRPAQRQRLPPRCKISDSLVRLIQREGRFGLDLTVRSLLFPRLSRPCCPSSWQTRNALCGLSAP